MFERADGSVFEGIGKKVNVPDEQPQHNPVEDEEEEEELESDDEKDV